MVRVNIYAATPSTNPVQVLGKNPARKTVLMRNNGNQIIYLHTTNGVTASNGFPLNAGDAFEDNDSESEWWAVAASGTGDLRIIETTK